jgi:uncharacterized protein (TIGR00266 family)
MEPLLGRADEPFVVGGLTRFNVVGDSIQRLDIELGPKEKVYAEGGHLIYKSQTVRLTASAKGGLLSGLKRALTGATFFVLELEGPGSASLAGFAPGKIVEIELSQNDEVLAEHRSFLAAEESVSYDASLTGLGFGWLGGEGLLMAKFRGPGRLFLHTSGDAVMLSLGPGESVDAEAGHVLAFDSSVKVSVGRVGGFKTMLFGEEGLWFARATGPGRIWLRTLSRQQIIMGLMPDIAKVVRA